MISSFIQAKFPVPTPHGRDWRDALVRICTEFAESELSDRKFTTELTSGDEQKFWACASEACIAKQLEGKTFPERTALGKGPDFLVMDGGKRVWIEVTCPQPVNIPEDYLHPEAGKVLSVPHEEILLRWTSVIQAKAERLLGTESPAKKGYVQAGIVGSEDVFVVAVNGCRMRHGPFSSLVGISQFPVAAEAVFGFGSRRVTIDTTTMRSVDSGHAHRPFVTNKNRAEVPTHAFLDPRYNAVSAIWAVDLNGYTAMGGSEPMYVVHNPNASNPLSSGFLPSDCEYVARREGDSFVLE